jgi:hypothetical protein
MDAAKHIMTSKETAEFLGIKEKRLREWRCRGFGPRFHKMGHLVRYKSVTLRGWQASQEYAGTFEYDAP